MAIIDEIFELLELAINLDKSGKNRIEASTKYYEAVYLMQNYVQKLPQTSKNEEIRRLLQQKITQYRNVAHQLLKEDDDGDSKIIANNDTLLPCTGASSKRKKRKYFKKLLKCIPQKNKNVISKQPSMLLHVPNQRENEDTSSERTTHSALINEKANLANTKLTKAMDLDEGGKRSEAIQKYMEAAAVYLEAIKLSEQQPSWITPVLIRRVQGAFDRVEFLKNSNSHTKNVRLDDKAQQDNQAVGTPLSKEEVTVLKYSSLIASGVFLPWSEEEAQELSPRDLRPRPTLENLFHDKDGDLALSDKLKSKFAQWARPSEIAQLRTRLGVSQKSPTMIRMVSPYTICQEDVPDCSFIASLCICAEHERRFRQRLITSIIYPQDQVGNPIYNPEGKYFVKLWLNGVARQVVVDDRLPIDENGNLLCSHTTGNQNQLELWVSIIEKAYMKLCGGYDFPGSNSGVDMFSLTGWIPEDVFFAKKHTEVRDFETPPQRAWERLFSANSFGDCLITVSATKDLTEHDAEALGIVTGHAYAVLNVTQTRNGTRLLQLKNPWASKGWTGRFSSRDTVSWQDPAFCAEVGYNAEIASQHDDGVFWISWDDVLQYFQNIHMSWNPMLFSHRLSTHSFWPKEQGPADDMFCYGENPQYLITLSTEALQKKATIWILLSRHVTKQEQEGTEVEDFLTVHLFKNDNKKQRIWYPGGSMKLATGAYFNNPHVLMRYDVLSIEDEYISVVLSQYHKSRDLAFTLSCYSTESFALGKPVKELEHIHKFDGFWTRALSGGPVGATGYFDNPMYSIVVPESGSIVQIRCTTSKTYAVNLVLVPVGRHVVGRLSQFPNDPAINTGNYRHGFVITSREELAAGSYVLIVSTFNAGQLGEFNLVVTASEKIEIQVLV